MLFMKQTISILIGLLLLISEGKSQFIQTVTTADGRLLLQRNVAPLLSTKQLSQLALRDTVYVNDAIQFQKIEGFGYTLTGGSAALLHQMPKEKRQSILNELFGQQDNGIHINYLRISLGASDLDANVFSYDDLALGEVDPDLKKMSITPDLVHLIPILKEIKAIQPALKLMATPWSPPIWMKDNGQSKGGHLLPKYFASYAQYFVQYIQLMQQEGLSIHAVTIQNEPAHGGNNPSMLMTAEEQTNFIKNHLGPAFKKAGIHTEIVIWDHNADQPDYPIQILNDTLAKPFVSASAFHLYLGHESALSKVHQAHPDKKIYFTEQWTGAKGNFADDFMWHMEHVVLGTMENWSSLVLEWNLANDPTYGPHTPGGCTECLGALTIDGSDIQRNVSYYIIGQVAPYILPGTYRIQTKSTNAQIQSVGFKRQDGKKVFLALNKGKEAVFTIDFEQKKFNFTLPEKSASTIIF
jgi:glucosylceramidase